MEGGIRPGRPAAQFAQGGTNRRHTRAVVRHRRGCFRLSERLRWQCFATSFGHAGPGRNTLSLAWLPLRRTNGKAARRRRPRSGDVSSRRSGGSDSCVRRACRVRALMRILIAGVGNVLRGDDGFGVLLLRELQKEISTRNGVRFFESGIAGVSLVQQLLDGYDALIV